MCDGILPDCTKSHSQQRGIPQWSHLRTFQRLVCALPRVNTSWNAYVYVSLTDLFTFLFFFCWVISNFFFPPLLIPVWLSFTPLVVCCRNYFFKLPIKRCIDMCIIKLNGEECSSNGDFHFFFNLRRWIRWPVQPEQVRNSLYLSYPDCLCCACSVHAVS